MGLPCLPGCLFCLLGPVVLPRLPGCLFCLSGPVGLPWLPGCLFCLLGPVVLPRLSGCLFCLSGPVGLPWLPGCLFCLSGPVGLPWLPGCLFCLLGPVGLPVRPGQERHHVGAVYPDGGNTTTGVLLEATLASESHPPPVLTGSGPESPTQGKQTLSDNLQESLSNKAILLAKRLWPH